LLLFAIHNPNHISPPQSRFCSYSQNMQPQTAA
jgi:hypothetical protein